MDFFPEMEREIWIGFLQEREEGMWKDPCEMLNRDPTFQTIRPCWGQREIFLLL